MSFVRPREYVLTHDTRHVLLQSENVFELGGITIKDCYFHQLQLMLSPISNNFDVALLFYVFLMSSIGFQSSPLSKFRRPKDPT